jgi:sterol desaturase/sphingolipid hydroxylase (fatty acid hydroxylase superfamily)
MGINNSHHLICWCTCIYNVLVNKMIQSILFEIFMLIFVGLVLAGTFLLGAVQGEQNIRPKEEHYKSSKKYSAGLGVLIAGLTIGFLAMIFFYDLDKSYMLRKVLERCKRQ